MKLGQLEIKKTAALAPMAGVADTAFRLICKEYGAAYVVGELVSAKGMTYHSKNSAKLLEITGLERPMAVQLFGGEPETMAEAAEMSLKNDPDVIDINMGCPAPKVTATGAGSALMRDLPRASRIIEAVRAAVPSRIPVTVKFRKGWDSNSVNAVEFARMAEQSGAAAVTIHGRTREQMYAPSADWEIIRKVKEAVSIPVIGNGDVDSPQAAAEMYRQTGADLVMVGRGALGRPWLFAQIWTYLTDGSILPDPPLEERMAVMMRHIRLAAELKGEYTALRESRKHIAWYLKGVKGAAKFRNASGGVSTIAEAEALALAVIEENRFEP